MTTTENERDVENVVSTNGTPEVAEASVPTVKYPTYLDLVKAVWKLGYDLSGWGDRDVFCVDGVNGYLRHFGLPNLVEVDGNMELADEYLEAWHKFTTWNTSGTFTEADDQEMRARLARSVRAYLRREEPKPRETLNEWLTELGLEAFAPPAPPRHIGRYDVSYNASNNVTSARIQEALRLAFGERADQDLDVRVSYVGRIA